MRLIDGTSPAYPVHDSDLNDQRAGMSLRDHVALKIFIELFRPMAGKITDPNHANPSEWKAWLETAPQCAFVVADIFLECEARKEPYER